MRIGEERMRVDPNPGVIIQGGGGADEEFCEYDETGRVLNWWDSEGRKEVYEYEADGNAVCTDEEGSVYRFDPKGNLVYIGDQENEYWAEYNSFGKSIHYGETSSISGRAEKAGTLAVGRNGGSMIQPEIWFIKRIIPDLKNGRTIIWQGR